MAVVASLNSQQLFPPLLSPNSHSSIRPFPRNPRSKLRTSSKFQSITCELRSSSDPSNSPETEANSLGVKAALGMLRFYKREISPILPNSCRYVPTCSEYSMAAYKKYGVVKGTVLTAWRLCRCNPLGGSGFDPPRWFGEERPSEEE
ncbi:UPF0161 protein At3g09310 isoform X2 [Syzygium oleosum]|uniref:UPF0161 protein At3g09310 isoform X2 n=1 Tax=Syzygium oleosum TaxID=219896 RepID=UPI0011D1BE29|nr:UPF0161 protein At3g09310 isoform X2 [Syzygium oleosum]